MVETDFAILHLRSHGYRSGQGLAKSKTRQIRLKSARLFERIVERIKNPLCQAVCSKRFFNSSISEARMCEIMTPTKNLTIRCRKVPADSRHELALAGFD